jgi:hypothetical protein
MPVKASEDLEEAKPRAVTASIRHGWPAGKDPGAAVDVR